MSSREASLIARLPKDLDSGSPLPHSLGEAEVVGDPPRKDVQIAPALHGQPVNAKPLMPLLRADDLEAQGSGRVKQLLFILLAPADDIDIFGGVLEPQLQHHGSAYKQGLDPLLQNLAELLEQLVYLLSPGDAC